MIRDDKGLAGRARYVAAASVLALATAFPATALAQTTPPADPPSTEAGNEDIVVTGIQYSLETAIGIRRAEDSIVEVVSAEEIGKLPDVSIAESLARLPGLTAQRVGGRAQVISIRGLAPDFSTTLLNGRQQASSGDNRGVEFDQYPSELLASVVVYKTPDANVAGMGLSGTADLRTIRPLEFGERAIALNMRAEITSGGRLNDDIRNYGGRATFSYIDQNAAGTLGWAIGFAHLDSPTQNFHYKAYNYETFCCGQQNRISPAGAQSATFLTGQEIFATSRSNRRDAVIGILEWEPSDAFTSRLDVYYSRFRQREVTRGAQWFSNVWADNQNFTNVGTGTVGGTTVGITGTNTGVAPIIRNDYNTRRDELFSIGLNNEFQMSDEWSFLTDLSYSRNERNESITETYAGYGCCATSAGQNAARIFDTIAWDLTDLVDGSGYPTYSEGLDYADASRVSLGDRAPWGGWGHDGQTKEPHVVESVYALDLGLRYEPAGGIIEALDFGVNFTRREKTKTVGEFDLMLRNGRLQSLVGSQYLVQPTSLGYAGFGNVLSVNLPAALPVYYDRLTFINNDTYDKAWAIEEEVLTLRARASIEVGSLHGNVGFQLLHQRQASSGSAINRTVTPTSVIPIRQSAEYWDFLPSLNLIYELGGGHRLRLAAARTVARPRMDEMRANFTPSFGNPCGGSPPCVPGQTVNPWSASGGNPLLEPWRANGVDIAYEWYLGRASYFSVALFYKDLENYIFTQRQSFDFSGLPLPPTAANIPAGVIISPIGQINQPANGSGGWIRGLEISGALELGRIAPFLDGFGVLGSYSLTGTNLHPLALNAAGNNQTAIQNTRIPGLSTNVYSITGYFERGGFQARAAYRYRAAFKGEVTQLFAVRGQTEILAEDQLDAQIGYTFPEGSSLAGLGILLQANNLTNSPYRTRLGVDGGGPRTSDGSFLPEVYETYGRQFLLGFSYRF